jgi:hypothetical protein
MFRHAVQRDDLSTGSDNLLDHEDPQVDVLSFRHTSAAPEHRTAGLDGFLLARNDRIQLGAAG